MRRSADWCGLGTGVVRRVVRAANSGLHASCILRLLRISKLAKNQSKAVFDLKLLVGGALHKVVLDERGFSAYNSKASIRSHRPALCELVTRNVLYHFEFLYTNFQEPTKGQDCWHLATGILTPR